MNENIGCIVFLLFYYVLAVFAAIKIGSIFSFFWIVAIPSFVIINMVVADINAKKKKDVEIKQAQERIRRLRRKSLQQLATDEIELLATEKSGNREAEDFYIQVFLSGNKRATIPLIKKAEEVNQCLSYNELIDHCDRINRIVPNGKCYYRKGCILEYLGEAEKALESFNMVIKISEQGACPENNVSESDWIDTKKRIGKLQRIVDCKRIEREGRYDLVKTGIDYERFVYGIIKRCGFACSMTPPTDQGVDIVVTLHKCKVAVQCKFLSQPVSNSAVQEVVAGKPIYHCQYACVVSKSGYTQSAKKLANVNNVKLLKHDEISQYLNEIN